MKKVNKKSNLTDLIRSEKYTIDYDGFDLSTFKEILEETPKIKDTYEEGMETYPQFKELHQDVFDSLYKYEPEKIPEDKVDYEYLLNSKVMDAVMKSPKYKEMRLLTRLDVINSTMGTQVIGDEVKDLVKTLQDQFQQAAEKAKEAAEALQEMDSEDSESGSEGAAGTQATGLGGLTHEEAKKQLQESMSEIDDLLKEKEEYKIQNILNNAMMEAKKTSDLLLNWGLEHDPKFRKSGHQEKIRLIDRLKKSEKLRELSRLAGRYKRWAVAQQKTKTQHGVVSIRGLTIGADIGKLLPSETMKLKHPVLKKLFKKDFLEKKLTQYKYYPMEKESRGPIVCCIDSSGSMGGSQELWAKAVAMGLLEISRFQQRSFYVIHFSSGWREEMLHVNDFRKSKPFSILEVLDMAEYFEGGGTTFEPPLNLARTKIETEKDFSKADIVFITDGQSVVRNDWLTNFNEWKKTKGVKVYSVLIDASYNYQTSLDEFSDSVLKLSEITEDSFDKTASVLFRTV